MADLWSAPDSPGARPALAIAQIDALRNQLGGLEAKLEEHIWQAASSDAELVR